MKQRGVSENEVLKTINTGTIDAAKYGRVKFSKTFSVKDDEKRKSFTKKTVIVFADKIGSQIDVISVLVKFY